MKAEFDAMADSPKDSGKAKRKAADGDPVGSTVSRRELRHR